MLYLDKDGQFQDTHPDYEKQVEKIGNEIIDSIEDEFIDEVEINSWHESGDCCEAGTYWEVNWSPDLETMIKGELAKYKEEPYFDELEDYVRDNIRSEEDLCGIKADKYLDDDDCPY